MRTMNNNYPRYCTNPAIIAGRLISIRNIYLRQELYTISNRIQENYKERLPALHLVSLAAYEQVFNRQPLSLPEELRRDAVKYGLRYYQLNIEKLRTAEAQNGLYPNHDRLSCTDKRCPLHELNLSDSQHSVSLQTTKSEHNSTESSRTSKTSSTFDTSSIDTNSMTTSVSSDYSSTTAINKYDSSSTSTFADTTSNTSLNSSTTDSFSQRSASKKKLSRTKPPKIIVRRASDNDLTSSNTKKQSIDTHRLSPHKRRSRKKKKKSKG